jgi:hypothetical protein
VLPARGKLQALNRDASRTRGNSRRNRGAGIFSSLLVDKQIADTIQRPGKDVKKGRRLEDWKNGRVEDWKGGRGCIDLNLPKVLIYLCHTDPSACKDILRFCHD